MGRRLDTAHLESRLNALDLRDANIHAEDEAFLVCEPGTAHAESSGPEEENRTSTQQLGFINVQFTKLPS